ncbi:hypothetical protein NC652_020487 [Populus alba x Populus x berolinensis]|nr:hypothetical protein NC652_020487 [Populus alba x Populus x berolinensis]
MPPGSRVKILSIAVDWQEAHQKLQLDLQYTAEATCGTLPPARLASQIPPTYLGKPETFPNSSGMYSLPHLHIIGQH